MKLRRWDFDRRNYDELYKFHKRLKEKKKIT